MSSLAPHLSLQDLVAIAAAAAAAAWLFRTLLHRLLAPPCGPPPGVPPGHDGFIPLEGLTRPRPQARLSSPGGPNPPSPGHPPGRPSLPG